MITYADTTRLSLRNEASWGVVPQGYFTPIHVNSENFAPQIRSIQPQQLDTQQPRIWLEEMASGEIEAPVTTALLASLLPNIMSGDIFREQHNHAATLSADADGCVSIATADAGKFETGDFIWLDAPGQNIAGFRPVKKTESSVGICGLPENLSLVNAATTFHKFNAGHDQQSFCIARKYAPDDPWTYITGLKIRRLVFDMGEGRPPLLNVSMIGRSMWTAQQDPEFRTSSPPEVFDLNQHLKSIIFTDAETGEAINSSDVVMTGMRLVLERSAMVPQFALGEVQPRLIIPGSLMVTGSLTMLVNGDKFFKWLNNRSKISMVLVLHSGRSGFAMVMRHIELTGVDTGALSADQPVQAVFHFADNVTNGTSPISFFLHNPA